MNTTLTATTKPGLSSRIAKRFRHGALTLGLAALLSPAGAATITFSNLTTGLDGFHGVADQVGTLLGGAGGGGALGRLNLTDSVIQGYVQTGNFAALEAAFTQFGASFGLDGGGANGAVEASLSQSTTAGPGGIGGSAIFVWLYKGPSRAAATEYFLAKLNVTFPTDPGSGDPGDPVEVYLRPTTATLFAGFSGPQTHDYGLGGGAAPVYRMTTAGPAGGNQPPIANNGTLEAVAGVAKAGQLTGSDPDDDDLTFAKTVDPLKGVVVVQPNGSFVYTAGVGQTGADSFKFRVNDGTVNSAEATISITIAAPPPNQAPTGVPASFAAGQNDLLTGVLQGTDVEGDPLTFAVGTPTANGVLTLQANGSFTYLPNHQFLGDDRFTFVVNDGTSNSAPTTVVIVVRPPTPVWTWVTGEQATNLNGVYGTRGTAAATNRPGSRSGSATASKGSRMYVFGGQGRGAAGGPGLLNDLWEFDSDTREWTWLAGGTGINQAGVYGTQTTGDPANVPGGRSGAVMWMDSEENLWMFGGNGRGASASVTGELNDLWKYDTEEGEWIWMKGSSGVNANGAYGQLGFSAPGNVPGGRSGASGWQDASGKLWVFGGRGRGSAGATSGFLNDVWGYDPAVNEWTHYLGSSVVNQTGSYSSENAGATNPGPGGRSGASTWVDAEGQVWLFGGQGFAASGGSGFLNDLWVFSSASRRWQEAIVRPSWGTRRSSPGPIRTNVPGVNGVLGVPGPGNYPASRSGASAVMTANGKLVLFGGTGAGSFNDVWSFDPATMEWTWLKGHSRANQPGVYGQKGIPSASNTPGARGGSAAFLSPQGQLWVFGGATGSQAQSDGWRLRLPAGPTVRLDQVVSEGETEVDVEGVLTANVSVGETEVSIEYREVGGSGEWDDVALANVAAAAGEVAVTGEITGLSAGTSYEVRLRSENAAGTGYSAVRQVMTPGVRVAPLLARFAGAASVVKEGDGAISIEVELSGPAPGTVTIPLTYSGIAQQGADYAAPPAEVVLFSGQTRANVVLSLINDLLIEGTETLRVDLGTPVPGAVGLGGPGFHVVQIEDNDAPVQVTVPSVLAELGAAATFQATVSVQGSHRYQWKKAGRKIAGATGPVLTLPAVTLADATSYTVDVTLPNGTVRASGPAQLAVLDVRPRRVLGRAGVPVTLPTTSAGAGLSFEWTKSGGGAVLGTGGSLVLASPGAMDSGDYVCTVRMLGVGQLVCDVALNVVTDLPEMSFARLPDGHAGASYFHQLEATNLSGGEANTFTVTGLPKGMTASVSGLISGVPTAPVVDKAVTIIASNPIGATSKTVLLTILPVPADFVNSFGIWFGPQAGMPGGGVGGRIDLTVTSSGSYTARLQAGADVRTAKGPLRVGPGGLQADVEALFVKKGAATLKAELTLRTPVSAGLMEVEGSLRDTASGGAMTLVSGVKRAAQPVRAGGYRFGLLLGETAEGVLAVPQGDGFGTCTVSGTGTASFAGRAGDGSVYTASTVMGKDGHMPLYLHVPAADTAGGMAGMCEVTLASGSPFINGVDGELSWTRSAAASKAKTRSYRAGFGPVEVALTGGVYLGPNPGGVIGGLATVPNNARLEFENHALLEGTLPDVVFTIANAGGVAQKVTVPGFDAAQMVNPNPARVTFKLDTKLPGGYSGTFVLPGATPALARKGVYQGLFVRLPTGAFVAPGYFLVAQPPEPGVTTTAAPELSGRVSVGPTNP